MNTLLNKQRGAMFGIDARLMLAIFSGLAVVTGASIGGVLTGSKATGITKDVEAISNAVQAIQQDFKGPIHTISGSDGRKNLIALFELDTTYISSANQADWLGPYIEEMPVTGGYPQNRFYGRMTLEQRRKSQANACSTALAAPCYYWLSIGNVPNEVVKKLNDQVDGTSEGSNANTQGKIRWYNRTSGHVAYPNELWIRIGTSIKR